MAAEIKVGIGADVKPLEKGLETAEKSVKAFDASVDKMTDKSAKAFDDLSKTAIKSNKAIGVSFQGTSRVVQDFAFGPGAIANNLAGLGDDWRQLAQTAKDSNQSIGKTLISSLTGAGGINLALGGFTLALSLASFGLAAWTRLFPKAADGVNIANQSLEDFAKTLNAVDQTQLKGAQNAQAELTSLNILFKAYRDGNRPLSERKEAYKQLQEQYPDYFGNLQFEETQTGKTQAAYDKLTKSLLENARSRAALDLITAKASEKLTNEQKITELRREQLATNTQIASLTAKAQKGEISFSSAIEQQTALYDKRNQAAFEIQTLQKANAKLTLEQIDLEKAVTVESLKGADAAGKAGKALEGVIVKVKEMGSIPSLDSAFGEALTKNFLAIPQKFKDVILLVNGQIASLGVDAPGVPGLDLSGFKNAKAEFDKNKQPLLDGLNTFASDVNKILNEGLINTLSGVGAALGDALANGTSAIEAVGDTMLVALGSVLVQLGQLAIATGVGIEAIKTAFKSLGGVGAIAAGVALVALGTAVKGKAKGIGKGIGAGGESGGGSFNPGVASGFNPSAPATGGGSFQTIFIPSMTLKGNDIVVAFNRTNSLNARTGR